MSHAEQRTGKSGEHDELYMADGMEMICVCSTYTDMWIIIMSGRVVLTK